jgi:hypothetical protein
MLKKKHSPSKYLPRGLEILYEDRKKDNEKKELVPGNGNKVLRRVSDFDIRI